MHYRYQGMVQPPQAGTTHPAKVWHPPTLDELLADSDKGPLKHEHRVAMTPRFNKDMHGSGYFTPQSIQSPLQRPQRRVPHSTSLQTAKEQGRIVPGDGRVHTSTWAWNGAEAGVRPSVGEVRMVSVKHGRGHYGDYVDDAQWQQQARKEFVEYPPEVLHVFERIDGFLEENRWNLLAFLNAIQQDYSSTVTAEDMYHVFQRLGLGEISLEDWQVVVKFCSGDGGIEHGRKMNCGHKVLHSAELSQALKTWKKQRRTHPPSRMRQKRVPAAFSSGERWFAAPPAVQSEQYEEELEPTEPAQTPRDLLELAPLQEEQEQQRLEPTLEAYESPPRQLSPAAHNPEQDV